MSGEKKIVSGSMEPAPGPSSSEQWNPSSLANLSGLQMHQDKLGTTSDVSSQLNVKCTPSSHGPGQELREIRHLTPPNSENENYPLSSGFSKSDGENGQNHTHSSELSESDDGEGPEGSELSETAYYPVEPPLKRLRLSFGSKPEHYDFLYSSDENSNHSDYDL